jgi:hypothetical protein
MQQYFRFFLFLIVLVPPAVYAQEGETVVIAGVVVDADSVQALPSVHLRVPGSKLGGVTEADGRFRFNVDRNDTIVFSSVGYQSFYLLPADSSAEKLQKLVIRMKPQVTVLEGVEVKDHFDFSRYLQPKIDSTVDMRRSRGTPLFEDKETREPNAIGTVGGPNGAQLTGALTAFANLFNDDFQQQKKLKEILAMEEAQAKRDALQLAMTEKYQAMLTAATDFGPSDIRRFTEMYMPNPYVMMEMSDYKLMESIIFHLDGYQKQEDFLQELLKNGKFEGEGNAGSKPSQRP